MTQKKAIGQRIRELREMNDYTREYFAERVDISPKFLYEIEIGKKGFSAEVLYSMSKVLCVSCEYIMEGEYSQQRESEKIMSVLENMEPMQVYRIQNMLQVLCEITRK